jgi:hypothetical protein
MQRPGTIDCPDDDVAGSTTLKPVQPVLLPKSDTDPNKECADNDNTYGFKIDGRNDTYDSRWESGIIYKVYINEDLEPEYSYKKMGEDDFNPCVSNDCGGNEVELQKPDTTPEDYTAGSVFTAEVVFWTGTVFCGGSSSSCSSPNPAPEPDTLTSLNPTCVSCGAEYPNLYFKWSTGPTITNAVAVKAADTYNLYTYGTGGSGEITDSYLHSPVKPWNTAVNLAKCYDPEKPRDISHISFCFDKFACVKEALYINVGEFCPGSYSVQFTVYDGNDAVLTSTAEPEALEDICPAT